MSSSRSVSRTVFTGLLTLCLALCGLNLAAYGGPVGPPTFTYHAEDVGFRLGAIEGVGFFPAINSNGQVASGHRFVNGISGFFAARSNPQLTEQEILGSLGGLYSNGFGINVNAISQISQVVGEARTEGGQLRAFLFTDGASPEMVPIAGNNSRALKINSFGAVAGTQANRAFRWNGSLLLLPTLPGGSASQGLSINESGEVVGVSEVFHDGELHSHAFFWSPFMGTVDLGALGNHENSEAWDINNRAQRQIVGASYVDSGYPPQAFRHTMTPLPSKIPLGALPGHDASVAYAVNDDGVVVGTSDSSFDPNPRAFVWEDANHNGASDDGEMQDLNDRIDTDEWELQAATDINNAGQITGYGLFNGEPAVFRLSPPDAGAPNIFTCSVFPEVLTATGGEIEISAGVIDDIAIASVTATITFPDSSTVDVPMERGGQSPFFSAFYTLPENLETEDQIYSVEVTATDIFDNESTMFCGIVTVLANAPPVIHSCELLPPSTGALGGTFTICAEVTDDIGLESVDAVITLPGGGTATISLDPQGETDTYCGDFTVPANLGPGPVLYPVSIEAEDIRGLTASEDCGAFTVNPNAPSVFSNCTITPTTLNAAGGNVTLSVDVTDPEGVDFVNARITLPDAGEVVVALPRVGGTNTFSGVYAAPGNFSAGNEVYSVQIEATDTLGDLETEPCGSFTVLPNEPPVIVDCKVLPFFFPEEGGVATLTAKVTDELGVDSVSVQVTGPGLNVSLPLTLTSGSSLNGTWSVDINVPANTSSEMAVYDLLVTATDTRGATDTEECGPIVVECTVPDDEAPVIANCSVSPLFLPRTGGPITIRAVVTDNLGLSYVRARITPSGQSSFTVPMSSIGGDLYEAVHNVTGGGKSASLYAIVIEAEDTRGNTASDTCDSVRVAAESEQAPARVEVKPGSLKFGKVVVGKTKRKKLRVRHVGGGPGALLVFRIGGLHAPFSFPNGKGSFGTGLGFITLGPNQEREIEVEFAPSSVGTFEQEITIITNDPEQPTLQVPCEGRGCKKK